MKFIEIEYVANGAGKKIYKMLIRQDTILSVNFAEKKNPILYYVTHSGCDFNNMRLVHLTQESYSKLKKQLEECE